MEEIKVQRNDGHTEDRDILEIVNTIEGRRKAEGSLRAHGEQPCTIYQVHNVLRQVNEKCYEPQLASIGPYHRGKEGLKPMEEKKFQYLLALLSRNPGLKLEDIAKEIKKLEIRARKCYSESISLKSKEFVEMMVYDGCFLVEIFLRIRYTKFHDELWLPLFVSSDMLLLENQLPFFILKSIFSLVIPIEEANLLNHILECFMLIYVLPLNKAAAMMESYNHVLDVFHHHCLPKREHVKLPLLSSTRGEDPSSEAPSQEPLIRVARAVAGPVGGSRSASLYGRLFSIPSAEELEEAGIEFQRKETEAAGSFLDVEFDKKGVLKIPFLYYSNNLQTIFQNLIAYEQCYPKAGTFFIGYGLFMDDLINTAKDVQILCRARILENAMGSDDQLAQHFNEMSRRIYAQAETMHLYSERRAINDYCRKKWPTWRARLMRDYLNNPWAIVSVLAAALLLLLTIIQTVFSVIPNV